MDPFKTMDPLGQTTPKDLLSNADGQNPASAPATTPVSTKKKGGRLGCAPVIKIGCWWVLVRKSEELKRRLDVKEASFVLRSFSHCLAGYS